MSLLSPGPATPAGGRAPAAALPSQPFAPPATGVSMPGFGRPAPGLWSDVPAGVSGVGAPRQPGGAGGPTSRVPFGAFGNAAPFRISTELTWPTLEAARLAEDAAAAAATHGHHGHNDRAGGPASYGRPNARSRRVSADADEAVDGTFGGSSRGSGAGAGAGSGAGGAGGSGGSGGNSAGGGGGGRRGKRGKTKSVDITASLFTEGGEEEDDGSSSDRQRGLVTAVNPMCGFIKWQQGGAKSVSVYYNVQEVEGARQPRVGDLVEFTFEQLPLFARRSGGRSELRAVGVTVLRSAEGGAGGAGGDAKGGGVAGDSGGIFTAGVGMRLPTGPSRSADGGGAGGASGTGGGGGGGTAGAMSEWMRGGSGTASKAYTSERGHIVTLRQNFGFIQADDRAQSHRFFQFRDVVVPPSAAARGARGAQDVLHQGVGVVYDLIPDERSQDKLRATNVRLRAEVEAEEARAAEIASIKAAAEAARAAEDDDGGQVLRPYISDCSAAQAVDWLHEAARLPGQAARQAGTPLLVLLRRVDLPPAAAPLMCAILG